MSYRLLRGFIGAATLNRFTAAANVVDGAVIVHNTRVGVVHDASGKGVLAAAEGMAIFGTDGKGIVMPKSTGVCLRNARAYWEAAGNPIGGIAASGAVTATIGSNILIGRFAEAAVSGDATATVHLTAA